jgi:hypothetical protein
MMRRFATMAALAVIFMFHGCGDGGPRRVPVSGTLTLNGKPLEGATVTFAPDPTNPVGTPGGAFTDKDGSYIAASDQRPGLAAGKYKVLVTKSALKNGAKVPDEFKDDPMMAVTSGLTIELLPPAYSNANTSPLSLDVPEAGGSFDFDVKQDTKAKKK